MTLFEFVSTNGDLIEFFLKILITILSFVCAVLVFRKTKNLDLTFNTFKECMTMARNGNYTQDFTGSNIKDEYKYNKQTGEIEPTGGKIDIQELINSCMETTLEAVLNRFMPVQTEEQVAIAEHTRMTDKLDEMAKLIETANEYKKAYNLDPAMSVQDVYKVIEDEAKKLKVAIDNYGKIVNVPIEKSEVKEDEKVVDEESK